MLKVWFMSVFLPLQDRFKADIYFLVDLTLLSNEACLSHVLVDE
jgi:hypothetical protein